MKTTKNTLLLAIVLALAATASPAAAQADFSKFVAIGASVDAGFLDNCWVKYGQVDSWNAILARQAGAPAFEQPLLDTPDDLFQLGLARVLAIARRGELEAASDTARRLLEPV